MALEPLTDIKGIPLRGGTVTVREKGLLPFGAFSMVQNMRGEHPGFIKRGGDRKKHGTADSTNEVLSLYQFSKGKRTERHFFAQMGDDDVLEATTAPPGIDTGAVFGLEQFSGTASSIPASWSNLNDLMVFSNGVDQHKIYAGTANYVQRFIKYANATTAAPNIPTEGFDYTEKVNNADDTKLAILDSLNVYGGDTTYHCIFICTPVPANRLYWTFKTGKVNGTAAVGTLSYWNGSAWADTSEKDGTIITTGKTLSGDGAMVWDYPTDEVPWYMYGISGFWYQWKTATQLDDEVEVQTVTYGTDGKTAAGATTYHLRDLVNVWDGILIDGIEAQLDHDSEYYTYATDSIEVGLMDENDKLYFNSADPVLGVYIDVGDTPAGGDITAIDAGYYWDGDSWVSLGTVTDGTNGLTNSGWVTWVKPSGTPQMSMFRTDQYYSYWFYLEIDDAASGEATPAADDIIISLRTMPYFDIANLGVAGYCNCAWKDRMLYNFGDQFIYVSAKNKPLSLNGLDFTILIAGDGRNNKVVNMKRFYNELMAFQEEKGKEGGCITLFEGYSPATFGKLVLSSQIGTLNSKTVVIVDGAMTSTDTERPVKTMGYTISHYGVFEFDGRILNGIDDDIHNYFDPRETTTCLRRGYEDKCWMEYDSSCNCLRLGLCCGTSATKANIFPVFDLTDRCWYFDTGRTLSCMTEVEAASGDLSILQYGGGTADGTVYQLNHGTNDVSTAINSYIELEFGGMGEFLHLRELLIGMKVQAAGNLSLTVSGNAIAAISAKSLAMTAEVTNQTLRRHRVPMDVTNQQISAKLQHNKPSESCYLQFLGINSDIWKKR